MDRERIEALIARLERDDLPDEQRDHVVESLQALTHQTIGDDPDVWWDWLDGRGTEERAGGTASTTSAPRADVSPRDNTDRFRRDDSDHQTWPLVDLRIERGLMVEEARNARQSRPTNSTGQRPEEQYETMLRQYGDSVRVPKVLWQLDSELFDWIEHVTDGAIGARLETTNDYGATVEIDGERLRVQDEQLPDLLFDRIARAGDRLEKRDFYRSGDDLWCLTDDQLDWLREVSPFGLSRLEPRDGPPKPAPGPVTFEAIVERHWEHDLKGLIEELGASGRLMEFDAEYGYPVDSYAGLNDRIDELLDGAFDEVEWEYIHEDFDAPQILRATCPDGTVVEREVGNSDWVDVPPWLDLLNTLLAELDDERGVCSIWDSRIYGQDMAVVVGTPEEIRQLIEVGLPVEERPDSIDLEP